jgi:TolB-like protein/DNA-binding winged helix-turn-helix (wHTH) protein/Flp pilus assembly protein TadD
MKKAFYLNDWLVEPGLDRIKKNGATRRLRPQVMDLLVYLASRPREIVSNEEILTAVWPGRITTPASVYNCLKDIRQALGDDPHNPAYIETIPKRGYRLIAPVKPAEDLEDSEGRRSGSFTGRRLTVTAAAILLAVVILVERLSYQEPAEEVAALDIPEKSIAVLPFEDMSENGDQGYFADGVAEEILNELAQLPDLKVTARSSSWVFRDNEEDLGAIGKKLGVAYLLEGSVRRDSDLIRITAQLIDARNSYHLWSQEYDLEEGKILEIQDSIGTEVANALHVALLRNDSMPKMGFAPRELDTRIYDLFLQAKNLINQQRKQPLRDAIALLQEIVEKEPGFMRGLVARIDAELTLYWEHREIYESQSVGPGNWAEGEALKKRLLESIDEVIGIRPDLAEAYLVRGKILRVSGREDEADIALLTAIDLNPNLSDAYRHVGLNNNQKGGSLSRTIEFLHQAVQLDPYSLEARMSLVRYLGGNADQRENAWALFRSSKSLLPWTPTMGSTEGSLLMSEGRLADAVQVLEDTLGGGDDAWARNQLAMVWYALGEHERARRLNPAEGLRIEKPDGENMPDHQRCSSSAKAGPSAWAPERAYTCVFQRDWDGVVSSLGLGDSGPESLVAAYSKSWLGRPVSPAFSLSMAHRMLGNDTLSRQFAALEQQFLDVRWDRGRTNIQMYTQMTARLQALRGEAQLAMDQLQAWIALGQLWPGEWHHPVYDEIRNTPRFRQLQNRRIELVNVQRAQLGLDSLPLIPSPY